MTQPGWVRTLAALADYLRGGPRRGSFCGLSRARGQGGFGQATRARRRVKERDRLKWSLSTRSRARGFCPTFARAGQGADYRKGTRR